MSVEAITWVLKDAPGVPPQLVSTLIGLANHATPDGRNAYPSQGTLATYTRKSERQVRRDIAELQRLGIIHRGNQCIVEHIPQDRRPVVYDLAMGLVKDLDGGTPTSARSSTSGRTPVTGRGVMGVRDGGTPTSAKPSYEPPTTVLKRGRAHEPTAPKPPAPAPRPDGLTTIPDDFAPTDSMRRWALGTFGERLDLNFETAQFVSHYRSTGVRRKSWPDAWQKWVRDSDQRASQRGTARSPQGTKPSTTDQRWAQAQALKSELKTAHLIAGELAP